MIEYKTSDHKRQTATRRYRASLEVRIDASKRAMDYYRAWKDDPDYKRLRNLNSMVANMRRDIERDMARAERNEKRLMAALKEQEEARRIFQEKKCTRNAMKNSTS